MTAMGMTRRTLLGGAIVGGLAGVAGCDDDPARTDRPTKPTGTPAPGRPPWARLRRQVAGTLLLPGSSDYDTARLLQNPRYDAQHPLAVLTVASAKDVSVAFSFAQDHGLPVAIRSGGHSYPGWSGGGSPRALVIDCRALNGVSFSGTSAKIGSGTPLAQVYDALAGRDRAIGGGSCATVGISGLTLGGGVGVLTRSLGLTCDQIVSMQVVTADGSVRTADANQEPDLFWALRGGGGGHVGVLTSLTFDTAEAPTINSFYRSWPISAAGDVVAAWQDWAPTADPRLWSTLKLLGGTTHPSGPVVMVSGTWTGPQSQMSTQLAPFSNQLPAPASNSDQTRSYRDAMFAYAGCSDIPVARCTTAPGGALQREAFAATSHVMYQTLDPSGIATMLDQVNAAQDSGLKEAGLSIDALGGLAGEPAADATAFVHRPALATVQYTATYDSGPARSAADYVRGFRAAMLPSWGDHAYVNYSDQAVSDPQQAYFGANADRLAQVRATYDPHGFFTQPQDW